MKHYKTALRALFYDLAFFCSAYKGDNTLAALKKNLGLEEPTAEELALVQEASALSLGFTPTAYMSARATWKGAQPLYPVLEKVSRGAAESPYTKVFVPKKLVLDDHFFPKNRVADESLDFSSNWDAFYKEMDTLISKAQPRTEVEYKIFLGNASFILQKYASAVGICPERPDTALYDHLKTASAFALCLARPDLDKENPFLLVAGDLSGIQEFIYDIVSKNASKNLKARSFLLQLLLKSVLVLVNESLGLLQNNTVYSSGGSFYLIAPNTAKNQEKLLALRKKLTEKIMKKFKTKLFLAMDSHPFSKATCTNNKGISDTWRQLAEKTSRQKRQRYKKALCQDYDQFFEPFETGWETRRDAITNEELVEGVLLSKDGNEKVNSDTKRQIELGKQLRKANKWTISTSPKTGKGVFNIADLGVYHVLTDTDEKGEFQYQFNSTQVRPSSDSVQGFAFYGGNKFPEIEEGEHKGEHKSFDLLAGHKILEFSRLGVLRMDVDNLGQAFISGFEEDQRTFSRYACLSRSLDFFFKGYLNTIWEEKGFKNAGIDIPYKGSTSIIYSGGDDLFIVGRWDALIAMAEKIRVDFKIWAGGNPKLTISGGIAIVSAKFPIIQGASLAAKMEKRAKNYHYLQQEKDAFCFFGAAVGWDNEFPIVKLLKSKLVQLIDSGKISKGLIGKLMSHAAKQHRYELELYKANKKPDPRYRLMPQLRWEIAYDLSQYENKLRDPTAKKFLSALKTAIFTESHPFVSNAQGRLQSPHTFLIIVELAARWAELERRTKETNGIESLNENIKTV